MKIQDLLQEVITLPEATEIAREMGYAVDRSNLIRYAQAGRLLARKSQGTWLTTRSALQALILELSEETRGRPRNLPAPAETDWSEIRSASELRAALHRREVREDEPVLYASQVESPSQVEPQSPPPPAETEREKLVNELFRERTEGQEPRTLPELRELAEKVRGKKGRR